MLLLSLAGMIVLVKYQDVWLLRAAVSVLQHICTRIKESAVTVCCDVCITIAVCMDQHTVIKHDFISVIGQGQRRSDKSSSSFLDDEFCMHKRKSELIIYCCYQDTCIFSCVNEGRRAREMPLHFRVHQSRHAHKLPSHFCDGSGTKMSRRKAAHPLCGQGSFTCIHGCKGAALRSPALCLCLLYRHYC